MSDHDNQDQGLADLTEASAARDNLNQTREISDVLEELQKQLAKFGREQFKLNTLVETQQRQIQAALALLSENDARRERERSEWLAARGDERVHARLEVVERILPALDGLDEAIASLERAANAPVARPSFMQRLFTPTPTPTPSRANHRQQIAAWRDGLSIVRDRLVAALAEEGVYPIETDAQAFDPALHVALQHAPANADHPAGTIVRELRRGYLAGDDVLRYAEVVVAK